MMHASFATKSLMAAATIAATIAGTAGVASAGSSNGGCALKMVNAHTWPGGMENAMSVDNPHGTAGMFGAVAASC